MAISFQNGKQSQEVIAHLGLNASLKKDGNLYVEEEDISSQGMDPSSFTELANSDGTIPLQAAGRLDQTIQKVGVDHYKKLVASNSCWMSSGQRRFFMKKMVGDEPQLIGHADSGVVAKCDYDDSVPSAMGNVFFHVSQMSEAIREQAAPAVIRINREDFLGGGTGVVVSPDGDVLTARHVLSPNYGEQIEQEQQGQLDQGLQGALRPVVIQTPRGYIKIGASHVVQQFSQRDLILLRIPELAGHPYVPVASFDANGDSTHYALGYPIVHDLKNMGEQCASYPSSAYEDCLWRGGKKSTISDSELLASVGETIPASESHLTGFSSNPNYNAATTVYARKGSSGGPVFVIKDGKPVVVGIVSALHDLQVGPEMRQFSLPNESGAIISYPMTANGTILVKITPDVEKHLSEKK